MVQKSRLDTVCITEKLKPRSAIKGTLRGVRGGENSPYSIFGIIDGLARKLECALNTDGFSFAASWH